MIDLLLLIHLYANVVDWLIGGFIILTGHQKHREEHRRQEHCQPHRNASGQLSHAGSPQVSLAHRSHWSCLSFSAVPTRYGLRRYSFLSATVISTQDGSRNFRWWIVLLCSCCLLICLYIYFFWMIKSSYNSKWWLHRYSFTLSLILNLTMPSPAVFHTRIDFIRLQVGILSYQKIIFGPLLPSAVPLKLSWS